MELGRRSPLGALPPGRNAGVWAGVADAFWVLGLRGTYRV